jgi:hypothetical protein
MSVETGNYHGSPDTGTVQPPRGESLAEGHGITALGSTAGNHFEFPHLDAIAEADARHETEHEGLGPLSKISDMRNTGGIIQNIVGYRPMAQVYSRGADGNLRPGALGAEHEQQVNDQTSTLVRFEGAVRTGINGLNSVLDSNHTPQGQRRAS